MNPIFYIIRACVDDNGQPIAGTEEAIGLLTNSEAIAEALDVYQERQLQNQIIHTCNTIQ